MNRKIPKSKWIPALLFVYLAVMGIIFGKENIRNGETVKFIVILSIELLVIIALYFFLKKKENQTTIESSPYHKQETRPTPKQTANQQSESLNDIQSQLTLQQREAAMCLISFFGGYNDHLMDNAPIMIFKQASIFFCIPDSPITMSKIMAKYTDADSLIDIVLSIKPYKAKEFILLSCYDLIKSTDNSEATYLLFNIANDMGYDKARFENLIHLYQ